MSATNRPLRVFLCHSSNDKPAVRELYQKLRAEAWIQPWLDEKELHPGQTWEIEIEKAVESSDVILVCLSNNSIHKKGYVQKELRFALDIALEIPDEEIFIIPLRLEECVPPRSLREWQYADYYPESQREHAFQRLLAGLKRRADSLGLKINEQNSIPSQDGKLYYPNKFGLIILKALEEVMGRDGLNAILTSAGLNHYVEKYPSDNLDRGFVFSELSKIGSAMEKMYGPRGGRGLMMRAGRGAFSDALRYFGNLAGAADLAFVVLPLQSKLRIGLPAFAKIFTQLSDQHTIVEEKDAEWIWTIYKCPCCWERTDADKPMCFMAAGLLQESLKWVSGGNEFRVIETKCRAIGDQVCEFTIQKEPIS